MHHGFDRRLRVRDFAKLPTSLDMDASVFHLVMAHVYRLGLHTSIDEAWKELCDLLGIAVAQGSEGDKVSYIFYAFRRLAVNVWPDSEGSALRLFGEAIESALHMLRDTGSGGPGDSESDGDGEESGDDDDSSTSSDDGGPPPPKRRGKKKAQVEKAKGVRVDPELRIDPSDFNVQALLEATGAKNPATSYPSAAEALAYVALVEDKGMRQRTALEEDIQKRAREYANLVRAVCPTQPDDERVPASAVSDTVSKLLHTRAYGWDGWWALWHRRATGQRLSDQLEAAAFRDSRPAGYRVPTEAFRWAKDRDRTRRYGGDRDGWRGGGDRGDDRPRGGDERPRGGGAPLSVSHVMSGSAGSADARLWPKLRVHLRFPMVPARDFTPAMYLARLQPRLDAEKPRFWPFFAVSTALGHHR